MRTPKVITQSAKGEDCTLNIAGVCNYDSETTVACHISCGSGGTNRLSGALAIAFGCSSCHDEIDGRTGFRHTTKLDREFYEKRGVIRTTNRLIEKGLVTVKGLK